MPTTSVKSKGSKRRSREILKRIVESALRRKFPHDTVDVSDGYDQAIHVVVVSRLFEDMSERARYAYLWRIVDQGDLTDAEKDLVTVVFGVSPRELK